MLNKMIKRIGLLTAWELYGVIVGLHWNHIFEHPWILVLGTVVGFATPFVLED